MGDSTAQSVFFYILAVPMVIGAIRVVTTRNIIRAALWLVVVLGGVAAQFVLLVAEFTAVTQVLVYIGAIIVLFIFGIMLTRAPLGKSLEFHRNQAIGGLVVAVGLLALLGYVLIDGFGDDQINLEVAGLPSVQVVGVVDEGSGRYEQAVSSSRFDVLANEDFEEQVAELVGDALAGSSAQDQLRAASEAERQREVALAEAEDDGVTASSAFVIVEASNTKAVSDAIFSDYIVPFEAISVLLLAALIGAVVLARKD